jgi:hypothetical protein
LSLYADDTYVEIDGQPHPVGEYIAFEDAPFTPLLDEDGLPLTHGEQSKVK